MIVARDDHFDPPCIDVAREGEITLLVRNEGHHPHNLTLQAGGSVSVDRGEAGFLAARVGGEGIEYFCTIHPGMRGRIAVSP